MFPFNHDEQSEDLVSLIPSIPHQQDLIISGAPEVLPSDAHKLFMSLNNNCDEANYNTTAADPHERKITRRDNERQRRQHMAILHASLRSLLPLEFIKGKRSISEHIKEAINYINYLKGKIEELNAKKEELKRVCGHCSSTDVQDFSPGYNERFSVKTSASRSNIKVGPTCWGGVEIVMSTNFSDEMQEGTGPLSGLLEALLAEGLRVVECASTTVNQSLFHTIQCEVGDLACDLDFSELHMKLNFL